jgi:anti-sigma factor RsiW
MSEHISTEGMHDLLDGQLALADAERARAHLDACEACREELEALAGTVEALRALPGEARAPDGLWTGIEGRLFPEAGASTVEAAVVPLSSARSRRRFSLTGPQLAAAALVVSLVSATVVWLALSGGARLSVPEAALGPEGRSAIQAASVGVERYDEVIRELEAILEAGGGVLAPGTLETLESSRATIDDALEDVRRALEEDPSSQLLTHLLIHHQKTKLRLLRQAAAAVQAMS